jgi:hypothetical protein
LDAQRLLVNNGSMGAHFLPEGAEVTVNAATVVVESTTSSTMGVSSSKLKERRLEGPYELVPLESTHDDHGAPAPFVVSFDGLHHSSILVDLEDGPDGHQGDEEKQGFGPLPAHHALALRRGGRMSVPFAEGHSPQPDVATDDSVQPRARDPFGLAAPEATAPQRRMDVDLVSQSSVAALSHTSSTTTLLGNREAQSPGGAANVTSDLGVVIAPLDFGQRNGAYRWDNGVSSESARRTPTAVTTAPTMWWEVVGYSKEDVNSDAKAKPESLAASAGSLKQASRWKFVECPIRSLCQGNNTCVENSTGELCWRCKGNFSKQVAIVGSKCEECPARAVTWAKIVLLPGLVCIVVAFVVRNTLTDGKELRSVQSVIIKIASSWLELTSELKFIVFVFDIEISVTMF